jgi:hypothetical protein
MPAQPTWFHRLAEIMERLQGLEISHVDRLAVEKLFGVRQRRARQIMAGLPGLQVGNAFAVERHALISRLENTASSDRFQGEIARRARLLEGLDHTRRQLAAGRVRIPVETRAGVENLPAGLEFRPGQLLIQFDDAQDLAAKLFQIAQSMQNDWEAFARTLENTLPAKPLQNDWEAFARTVETASPPP